MSATNDEPIITHVYTADPSAHVFDGKLYLYPSHDRDTGIASNDNGDQYDMADYHVFSMDTVGGPITDHGVALSLDGVPWASKQLWAPDAACINGVYCLYFPARDADGLFRIGVATAERPEGPFTAEPEPIAGTYSIDPCSFVDTDGQVYLYGGGLWGGQLQCWQSGVYDASGREPQGDAPALGPWVARLTPDGKALTEPPRPVEILGENGAPLPAHDHDRRFFEGAWVHRRGDLYYLSYSTGDTHYLVYAVGHSPYGPFTYTRRILEPVLGWTTHHSIVEFQGTWYLFHHDATLSGGQNHLRCVKVKELVHSDGEIQLA